MQLIALVKTTGSAGTGRPDSAAWSEKLRPIAMNLPMRATGRRGAGALDVGQRGGVERGELGEAGGRQRVAVDVGDVAGKVADRAVSAIEDRAFPGPTGRDVAASWRHVLPSGAFDDCRLA